MRYVFGVVATVVIGVGVDVGAEAGPAGPIAASEAKGHVGEDLTVEMIARHVKDSPHEDCFFLDSEADYKQPENLAIVIAHEHAGAFKAAGIDDPATYYQGKRLRVSGRVIREKDQTRIRVTEPGRIEVVAAAKAP